MKIHERLKSKAVDIHIQKMASLTLNGAPLRAATNQYQRKGENARARERERDGARARSRAKPHEHCSCRVYAGDSRRGSRARLAAAASRDIAPWHATTGDRPLPSVISSRIIRKGRDSTPVRRHRRIRPFSRRGAEQHSSDRLVRPRRAYDSARDRER